MDMEPIHIPPPPGLDMPIPHPEEVVPMQDQPIAGGDNIVDMEVDKSSEVYKPTHRLTGKQSPLTAEQLQQVVATRWVITTRPSNNGTKDIKCRFCGNGFSHFIHDTDTQTFAATPSSMAMTL
eukprot:1017484-Amphidinium_carterae.1